MRVFGIEPNDKFKEYVPIPFQVQHEEAILESWLERNPDGIVEDGKLLIIGRQVATNFGGFIDLLAVDREGDVVVVELKRDRTPRDTIAQSLEYVSFAERLDTAQLERILRSYMNDESLNLAEHHREYFELGPDEAVAFNKDQRIVVVGQRITPEIRQTASFLCSKGIRVTCVEFTFFQANGGTRLLSQEIVVGKEAEKPTPVRSGSLPVMSEESFLSSLDNDGRAVVSRMLGLAKDKSMPIHWGTKGFSLNVDLHGGHVAICFVYNSKAVYHQSAYTVLQREAGIARKTSTPEDAIKYLEQKAKSTGLFSPAGRELKCPINRPFSHQEISSLLGWCEAVAETAQRYGVKE